MSKNTEVWESLEKTNPEHTKTFTRPGGFKGTAVKPIYCYLRMTEAFGPCGIGWGVGKPEYTVSEAAGGEIAVYCTASVWYEQGGVRSDPVFGVGGDFVVKKVKERLVVDDEAYKKAYTDAIGNAMKHIGMSADIHFGQHDDDKYVSQLRREFSEGPAETDGAGPSDAGNPYAVHSGTAEEFASGVRKKILTAKNVAMLNAVMAANKGGLIDLTRDFPELAQAVKDTHAHKMNALSQAPQDEAAE